MAEAAVPQVPNPTPVEKHPDGSPILKGANGVTFYPTEAEATKIAAGRTKGARHAYAVKDGAGKVRFAVAAHMHYVMQYIIETELKISVAEVGKVSASKAPVTAAGVLAAIDQLPEADREAIRKQLGLPSPKK